MSSRVPVTALTVRKGVWPAKSSNLANPISKGFLKSFSAHYTDCVCVCAIQLQPELHNFTEN